MLLSKPGLPYKRDSYILGIIAGNSKNCMALQIKPYWNNSEIHKKLVLKTFLSVLQG